MLAGKNVVITGAGRGVGKSIALSFAGAGANVACVARTKHEIDAVVSEMNPQREPHGECFAIVADVAAPEAAQFIYTEALQRLSHIDILINNAAIDRINPFEYEKDLDSWWRVLEVNLKGPIALVRHVLPGMLSRGEGTIISLGSRNAVFDIPYSTAYSAAKTALLRFHQCLQLEIAGRGVCTYVIQPGNVATTLTHGDGVINMDAVHRTPALARMLENTVGASSTSPNIAANLCLALVSDKKARDLSGSYIDAELNLGKISVDGEKSVKDRVSTDIIYKLNLEKNSTMQRRYTI